MLVQEMEHKKRPQRAPARELRLCCVQVPTPDHRVRATRKRGNPVWPTKKTEAPRKRSLSAGFFRNSTSQIYVCKGWCKKASNKRQLVGFVTFLSKILDHEPQRVSQYGPHNTTRSSHRMCGLFS